jgi:hypothetical protein
VRARLSRLARGLRVFDGEHLACNEVKHFHKVTEPGQMEMDAVRSDTSNPRFPSQILDLADDLSDKSAPM